jgi:hypothetical protein
MTLLGDAAHPMLPSISRKGEHGRRVSPTFRRRFRGLGSANPPPRAGKYAPTSRHPC